MYRPVKFPRLDNGSGFGIGPAGQKGAAAGGCGGGCVGDTEMAFKLLASPHAAGKIIGRGGTGVASLRQQCGVNVRITQSCFPNTGSQVVVLTGPRAGIDMALGLLVQQLALADAESGQVAQQMTCMAVLTSNAVSAVIGNKGSTIAQLRRDSGCNISADKDNISGEQVLRVTGAAEQMPYALAMVTPLVERSGDSMQLAKLEYGGGKGGPAEAVAWGYQPPKGAGKRKAFEAPAWPAIPNVIGKGYGGRKGYHAEPAMQKGGPVGLAFPANGHAPIGAAAAAFAAEPEEEIAAEEAEVAAEAGDPNLWDLAAAASAPFAEVRDAPKRGDLGFQSSVEAAEDPAVTESMTTINFSIPKESIGRVLGKGGEASAEIRRETGVSLKITPTEAEGIVALSGALQAVHRAHCMVVARVLAEF